MSVLPLDSQRPTLSLTVEAAPGEKLLLVVLVHVLQPSHTFNRPWQQRRLFPAYHKGAHKGEAAGASTRALPFACFPTGWLLYKF